MSELLTLKYTVNGDNFTGAGEASVAMKRELRQLGFDANVIRRAAIAMYEGEINMVIHAEGGEAEIVIDEDRIEIILRDEGPGIADIEQAMKAGFSTAQDNIRALGFGAGMGLPNMKRYSDDMHIDTKIGEGTTVYMTILADSPKNAL